ncbi:MAG TPA: methyltransferase domain-containing protein [bacterium]|nr:methyltransferase domain-containing protein [bacterium]
MNPSRLYDAYVAERFDEDPFDLYRECREMAVGQIRRNLGQGPVRVADLGCGTGELLMALASIYPQASLCGIDGSEKMLRIARAKLVSVPASRIRFCHDDLLHLERHVEPSGLDLATLHFVLARLDNRKLLSLVHRALRPGGWCSLATATHGTFPTLRSLGSAFLSEEFIRSSSNVPQNRDDLRELLRESGLEVVEESVHRKSIRLTDFDELRDFILHSGWFPHPIIEDLPDQEINRYRELCQPFLPIEDTAEKFVFLARKV